MEMKLRKTSLARRLLQQNAGLVLGGKKIASATKPPEGVVMEQLRHNLMILLCARAGGLTAVNRRLASDFD